MTRSIPTQQGFFLSSSFFDDVGGVMVDIDTMISCIIEKIDKGAEDP